MSFLIVRDTRVCYERNPLGSSELTTAEQRLWGKSWDGLELLSVKLRATRMIVGTAHNPPGIPFVG
jgi:hypothetical protein